MNVNDKLFKLIILKIKYLPIGLVFFCFNLIQTKSSAQIKREPIIHASRFVHFNHLNGPYTNDLLHEDFGNGTYPINRGFASIQDSVYKITFIKGQKVSNTGAAVQLAIEQGQQYMLQYRIKYDSNFQAGLHGKQFGFVTGIGYDGGRGAQARVNGDGGSVRLQFDAHDSTISNQLYVYYSEMTGDYGNNPGNQHFSFAKGKWNTIKMIVTMQTAANVKDGRIEIWCNGEKKIDVGNLPFVKTESGRKITKLSFESFPGGGGIFPTCDNYLYIDDLQFSKLK